MTAQEFAKFDLSELSTLLHSASRGRLGTVQAQALRQAAQQSVGVSFLADAVRIEVACLLEQLQLLAAQRQQVDAQRQQVAAQRQQVDAQRQQVDAAVAALMSQLPQYLTSIPGLGLVTSAMILAEIGDVARFSSLEKLVAYAGIDASIEMPVLRCQY